MIICAFPRKKRGANNPGLEKKVIFENTIDRAYKLSYYDEEHGVEMEKLCLVTDEGVVTYDL